MVVLAQWLPNDPGFWQLRQAVDSYQKIALAGGWPIGISGKDKEEFLLGARSDQIALLRQRLAVTGDYAETAAPAVASMPVELAKINPLGVEPAAGTPDPRVVDQALIDGIKHFQARHGLFADGVVGKMTLDALNVPVESRLRTMMINLRRLQLGEPRIRRRLCADQYRRPADDAGAQRRDDHDLGRDRRRRRSSHAGGGKRDHPHRIQSGLVRAQQYSEQGTPAQDPGGRSYIASQNFRVFDTATGQHVDPAASTGTARTPRRPLQAAPEPRAAAMRSAPSSSCSRIRMTSISTAPTSSRCSPSRCAP